MNSGDVILMWLKSESGFTDVSNGMPFERGNHESRPQRKVLRYEHSRRKTAPTQKLRTMNGPGKPVMSKTNEN